MYAKLISRTRIDTNVPRYATVDGRPTGNIQNNPEILETLGFLPYVPADPPPSPAAEGEYYSPYYEVEPGTVMVTRYDEVTESHIEMRYNEETEQEEEVEVFTTTEVPRQETIPIDHIHQKWEPLPLPEPPPVVIVWSKYKIVNELIKLDKLEDFFTHLSPTQKALWDAAENIKSNDPWFQASLPPLLEVLGVTEEALDACEV